MNNTINIITNDQCTGCGACYNKCPTSAITMRHDSEGFTFPYIDDEKCIQCGQCLKVCPVTGVKYHNTENPPCYAVMGSDEIREKSSSGGVFSILAEWIFDCGGVVCGAAYTEDCYGVEHILITNREDLRLLRGSKYVQSDTKRIYCQVKEQLEHGVPVLFTGTPCQISAIHCYLGKEYDNLYTLDLVCHGVPSPQVYEKFIREQEKEYSSKAVRVSFRDKDIVKWNVSTTIEFENGQKYRKKRNECAYLKSFLSLLTLRKSCGNCPFAKLPRQGDMTIADFWDIHRFNPQYDDCKGTSLVLSNNHKGDIMLNVLQKQAILCKEAPLEHGIKYNAQLKYSSILHPRRNRFFDLLNDYDYDFVKAVDYGMNRRFDIGYVGWWYGANYGSVLTNFALHQVLTNMGKSVLMLEWPILSKDIPSKKPDNKTRRFAKHFYEVSMMNHIEDYSRFNYHCETFLVGSDQLWNWWSNRDIGTYHFFLDFVDDAHKKIAYSTSFGHDNAFYPDDMKLKVSYLLHRFDAISVRETSGISICKNQFDVDAVQTVDPVFLCNLKEYEKAIALSSVEIEHKYVLAYILNPTEEKVNSVRYLAQEKNLPYHIILDGQDDFEKLKKETDDSNVLENVEIADWLKYFQNAEYVLTDSFHGFCFSIIFKRNVTVFPNKLRGVARFNSLAEMAGLQDRMVYSEEEFKNKQHWNKDINYQLVEERMRTLIDESRVWLVNALAMPKKRTGARTIELKTLLELKQTMSTELLKSVSSDYIPQDEIAKRGLGAKLNGGIKCYKDHGFAYTVKYGTKKILKTVFNK